MEIDDNVLIAFFTLLLGIVVIAISALILKLSTKILKLKDQKYTSALKVISIVVSISILFDIIIKDLSLLAKIIFSIAEFILLSLGLMVVLIKKIYQIDWKESFKVWGVYLGLSYGIFFIFVIIVVLIGLSLTFIRTITSSL